jgi:predicted ATPase
MIRNIFVNNFKTLDMPHSITLNPCSYLCGANSSGKSSLIQVILMLAQTFSNKFEGDGVVLNGDLIRLGSYSDIRKHDSKSNQITIGFSFEVGDDFFLRDSSIEFISCELILGRRDRGFAKIDEEYHPLIISAKYSITKKSESNDKKIDVIHFKLPDNYNELKEVDYEIVQFDTSESTELNKKYPNYKIDGLVSTGELIPTLMNIKYDKTKKISHEIINILVKGGRSNKDYENYYSDEIDFNDLYIPKEFSREVYNLILNDRQQLLEGIELPENVLDIINNNKKLKAKNSGLSYANSALPTNAEKILEQFKNSFVNINYPLQSSDLPSSFYNELINIEEWLFWVNSLDDKKHKNIMTLLEKHKEHLQNIWYLNSEKIFSIDHFVSSLLNDISYAMNFSFSRSIKYLGPLRNEPQAVYSSSPYDTNTVGLKGEFTASLLHRIRENYIHYACPEIINDKLFFSIKYDLVQDACIKWLSFLGVVEEVSTFDKGKLGYELYVKTSKQDKWQDLTHVGVGVSQVLPIVLMFLNSQSSDVLIFEQPELHLHPKVQSKLCDLFLIMSASGRQCIIETHSEYMINRLRLRVAQDYEYGWLDKSSLYFISKNDTGSIFKEVEINNFGAIPEWPADFFDQTDKEIEKILMEASKKRKKIASEGMDDDVGY